MLEMISRENRSDLAYRVASLERRMEAQDREIREAVALVHSINKRVAYLEGLREAESWLRQRNQV